VANIISREATMLNPLRISAKNLSELARDFCPGTTYFSYSRQYHLIRISGGMIWRNLPMRLPRHYRYGLNEDQAKLLEATLIDYVGLGNLTNRMRGNHSGSQPKASVEDIIRRYKAEDVKIDPDQRVILISVGRSFTEDMSREELYDYSRGVWKADWKKHRPRFALIVFQGVIREVYEIQGDWKPAGSTEYKYREKSEVAIPGRWEFEGIEAPEEIRSKYIGRSAREYFPKGSRNPLKYKNC
jgi:hypothetical protein